jgi:hypothetical protein
MLPSLMFPRLIMIPVREEGVVKHQIAREKAWGY